MTNKQYEKLIEFGTNYINSGKINTWNLLVDRYGLNDPIMLERLCDEMKSKKRTFVNEYHEYAEKNDLEVGVAISKKARLRVASLIINKLKENENEL